MATFGLVHGAWPGAGSTSCPRSWRAGTRPWRSISRATIRRRTARATPRSSTRRVAGPSLRRAGGGTPRRKGHRRGAPDIPHGREPARARLRFLRPLARRSSDGLRARGRRSRLSVAARSSHGDPLQLKRSGPPRDSGEGGANRSLFRLAPNPPTSAVSDGLRHDHHPEGSGSGRGARESRRSPWASAWIDREVRPAPAAGTRGSARGRPTAR